jgi:hypothetical protein
MLGIKTALSNVIRVYVRITLAADRNTLEQTIKDFSNIPGIAGKLS